MNLANNRTILIFPGIVLLLLAISIQLMGLWDNRLSIGIGYLIATLNFCATLLISRMAMRKSFDLFKLWIFGGMALRTLFMLALLFLVLKYKPHQFHYFSYSLLCCYGIYIIIEIGTFFQTLHQKHL